MAIGLKYGRRSNEENPQITWRKVDKFIEAFRRRWGAITCRELTGLNLKTAEGMEIYLQKVHDHACTERVKFAVRKAIEILSE